MSRNCKLLSYARTAFRIVFTLETQTLSVLAYLGWSLLLSPIAFLSPQFFLSLERRIYSAAIFLFFSAGWTSGCRYFEVGEDITSCQDDECLVIANHLSYVDVPTLATVFHQKRGVLSRLTWVMSAIFKYTHFGICSWIHGDCFIDKVAKSGDYGLAQFRKQLHTAYSKRKCKWIVLFPEGNFLSSTKASSQAYARKKNFQILEHVSYPRVGAFHAIINTFHPEKLRVDAKSKDASNQFKNVKSLKWVVDITIGYPSGKPISLLSMVLMNEKPSKIFLHYRRFPIDKVPTNMEGVTTWLNARFIEKDQLLKEFCETGSFPTYPSTHAKQLETPKEVTFDMYGFLLLNIFIAASVFLHYYILSWISCQFSNILSLIA